MTNNQDLSSAMDKLIGMGAGTKLQNTAQGQKPFVVVPEDFRALEVEHLMERPASVPPEH